MKDNSQEHHEVLKHVMAECEQPGLSFGVHNCDDRLSIGGQPFTQEQGVRMVDWYVNKEPMADGQRTTFCTVPFCQVDNPLMPSGLLGPMIISTTKLAAHVDTK